MNSVVISEGTFALVFGGALLGAFLGSRLPKYRLSGVAGMALGLRIGSAKSYYGRQSNELTQVSQ